MGRSSEEEEAVISDAATMVAGGRGLGMNPTPGSQRRSLICMETIRLRKRLVSRFLKRRYFRDNFLVLFFQSLDRNKWESFTKFSDFYVVALLRIILPGLCTNERLALPWLGKSRHEKLAIANCLIVPTCRIMVTSHTGEPLWRFEMRNGVICKKNIINS